MQRVHFLGKLSGANRKEATEVLRLAGGKVASRLDAEVDLLVVGDENILKQDWNLWNDQLDDETRKSFETGTLTIISETQFWEKYAQQPAESSQSLYTPSMLAKLTGVPVPILRKLQQERIIVPVRHVFRLCYFDKEVLLPLKIMQNMLAAGLSTSSAINRLQKVRQHNLSGVQIEGKDLVFVSERGSIDQNGQQRFVFAEGMEPIELPNAVDPLAILESLFEPEMDATDPVVLCEAACELEARGNLQGAADLYRSALAAGGASPLINFQLAEILYRQGDLPAARERYFAAIELDEHFVEARANLGCVLAELGRDDLALAAFRGALKLHPDYAEVRFHLGMLFKRQGRLDDAEEQFQLFRELMPECNDVPFVNTH